MCLGIPGKVIEIVDVEKQIAKVDVVGVRRNVNIALLTGDEAPGLGDFPKAPAPPTTTTAASLARGEPHRSPRKARGALAVETQNPLLEVGGGG
jgi:hypothetical protein